MVDDNPEQLSSLYHALRARRRRQVITTLTRDSDTEISVRRLARIIAAAEQGVSFEKATGEPYRNAYNALSQTHLPALNDVRVINYDSNRQIVTSAENHPLAATVIAATTPIHTTLWETNEN